MPETTTKLKIPLPTGNETVLRVHHREQLSAIEENAALDPFIIRAMSYESVNDRIAFTIGPGIAELYNGDAQVLVQKDTDTTYYINAPTTNTTYYLYLQADGTFTHNTTGTVPAGAVLLWQVATGATVSTLTKTDRRVQISGVGAKVVAHLADDVHMGAIGSVVGGTTASTTSATYVDLPDMSIALTTVGGDIIVFFVGSFYHTSAGQDIRVALSLDGAAEVASQVVVFPVANTASIIAAIHRFTGVSDGNHTVKARWKTTGATAYANSNNRNMLAMEVKAPA